MLEAEVISLHLQASNFAVLHALVQALKYAPCTYVTHVRGAQTLRS